MPLIWRRSDAESDFPCFPECWSWTGWRIALHESVFVVAAVAVAVVVVAVGRWGLFRVRWPLSCLV